MIFRAKLSYTLFGAIAILICLHAGNSPAVTQFEGIPRIIDVDTIDIGDRRFRLSGIDGPESNQKCTSSNGGTYRCGRRATDFLKSLIGREKVRCVVDGNDQMNRLLAHCYQGRRDVGAHLVSSGWALAFVRYSDEYVVEQALARERRYGLWSGKFQAPWEYRASKWVVNQSAPDPDCPIKGNVSRKGERIYHLPWDSAYDRTRISPKKGERWLCSEQEAVSQGWRHAR